MGRLVIACYRPRPGKREELMAAVGAHLDVLRDEGLVTDRTPVLMRAADGTLVEIFEWESPEAIEAAHANPRVAELWERFEASAEYVPVADIAEARGLFSEFEPVETG